MKYEYDIQYHLNDEENFSASSVVHFGNKYLGTYYLGEFDNIASVTYQNILFQVEFEKLFTLIGKDLAISRLKKHVE